jgi:multimeric flavodoxin WrbA
LNGRKINYDKNRNYKRRFKMKTILINGSPRKDWNTGILLGHASRGAEETGSLTETVNLYDLNYRGCISCFECKKRDGGSFGRCAPDDGLSPVLEKIRSAGALIIGSPIYMGSVTGEARSFLERFLFQYLLYTDPRSSSFSGSLKTGLIFDMGMPEERFKTIPLMGHLKSVEESFRNTFGSTEAIYCFDTYQMDDYQGIDYAMDPEKKRERRKNIFPLDCKKAYEMGKTLAKEKKNK